jgi:hypothetical protein
VSESTARMQCRDFVRDRGDGFDITQHAQV